MCLRANAHASRDELLALCRRELAEYKVPFQLFLVPSMPLNGSGKILKRELRDRALAGALALMPAPAAAATLAAASPPPPQPSGSVMSVVQSTTRALPAGERAPAPRGGAWLVMVAAGDKQRVEDAETAAAALAAEGACRASVARLAASDPAIVAAVTRVARRDRPSACVFLVPCGDGQQPVTRDTQSQLLSLAASLVHGVALAAAPVELSGHVDAGDGRVLQMERVVLQVVVSHRLPGFTAAAPPAAAAAMHAALVEFARGKLPPVMRSIGRPYVVQVVDVSAVLPLPRIDAADRGGAWQLTARALAELASSGSPGGAALYKDAVTGAVRVVLHATEQVPYSPQPAVVQGDDVLAVVAASPSAGVAYAASLAADTGAAAVLVVIVGTKAADTAAQAAAAVAAASGLPNRCRLLLTIAATTGEAATAQFMAAAAQQLLTRGARMRAVLHVSAAADASAAGSELTVMLALAASPPASAILVSEVSPGSEDPADASAALAAALRVEGVSTACLRRQVSGAAVVAVAPGVLGALLAAAEGESADRAVQLELATVARVQHEATAPGADSVEASMLELVLQCTARVLALAEADAHVPFSAQGANSTRAMVRAHCHTLPSG